jgi:hypothetical protein
MHQKTKSCIRFENIGLLNAVVSQVLSIHTTDIGINNAQSCCLVKQDEFSTTSFTSITPGKNIVTRYFNHIGDYSGGTVGLQFLVISKDLEEKIGRLKHTGIESLSFKGANKGLEIIGSVLDGQKEVQKHKLVAKLYPGCETDFGPVFRATDYLGEIKSEDFEFLVDTLLNFGGFSAEKQFESDIVTGTIALSIEDGFLKAVTANTKRCNQAYIEVEVPCSGNADYKFNIEGFNLKSLKGFGHGSPIIISNTNKPIDGKKWITFNSRSGVVTLREVASNLERVVKGRVFDEDSPLASVKSIRSCGIEELESSVVSQEPSGVNNTLLLSEQKPYIQVQDSQDIGAVEFSLVELSTETVINEWSTILVNKDAVLLACSAIKKFFTYTESQFKEILLIQKEIKKKNRDSPILIISSVNTASSISTRFFCSVNKPDSHIDQLNTKD